MLNRVPRINCDYGPGEQLEELAELYRCYIVKSMAIIKTELYTLRINVRIMCHELCVVIFPYKIARRWP